jgi:hypothetical protein
VIAESEDSAPVPDRAWSTTALCTLACLLACSSRDRPSAIDAPPARLAAPFVCEGGACVERHPRLPDDGEWSCSDVGGVAVCVGGDPPAGVPKNIVDPAWNCGPRNLPGAAAPSGERVCVDPSPEFPDGRPLGWSCRYVTEGGLARVCRRAASAHEIGDRCSGSQPCLDGMVCRDARCALEPGFVFCAFDRDCASHACRFGHCRTEADLPAGTRP